MPFSSDTHSHPLEHMVTVPNDLYMLIKTYLFHNLYFVYVVEAFVALNRKAQYEHMNPFPTYH